MSTLRETYKYEVDTTDSDTRVRINSEKTLVGSATATYQLTIFARSHAQVYYYNVSTNEVTNSEP